jgi:hypothetical protein
VMFPSMHGRLKDESTPRAPPSQYPAREAFKWFQFVPPGLSSVMAGFATKKNPPVPIVSKY